MEGIVKKKSKKKIVLVVLGVFLITVFGIGLALFLYAKHYMDTNTWATIRFTGTVESDTLDEYEESREFLKGDTYQLHNTTVTIEDITHDGEVTIEFKPAVQNADTGEEIKSAVIDKNNGLNIKEICANGDSASWQLRVTGNKYR